MISVVKAYNAYPLTNDNKNNLGINAKRVGYQQGYDQAMQDFLEKAERWLEIHMPLGEVSHESVYDCIQGFKNYMQNEM